MQPTVEEVETFLRKANQKTYADQNAPHSQSLRPGSRDYHFEEDDWAFHDTYFGGEKFLGEEVIYFQGKPIWGMNYYGRPMAKGWSEEYFDSCLRQALMQPTVGIIPVRGPRVYQAGDATYRFEPSGKLADFQAIETIELGGNTIYRCDLHGGLII